MKFFYFLFFFGFTFLVVNSQSRGELEKQRNSMLKEISETESLLQNIRKDKDQSLEVLSLLDKKINTRNGLIANITKDLSKVETVIKEMEANIGILNSDIVSIKREYARVIWISYLNREKLNHLMYILSATDINQAYRRIKYLKQYSDYRKRQVKAIQMVQTDITKKIILLDQQKLEKLNLLKSIEKEKGLLATELKDKTKLINTLKLREVELSAKIRSKNKLVDRIKSEIERLIRREIAESRARAVKANKSVKGSAIKTETGSSVSILTPEEFSLSNSFKDNRGKLPWPTERGIVTGFFGVRSHPVYKTLKIRNNGIDISTTEGSYVRAVFEGEVRFVIPILGANYSILVRHGNFYTVYTNIVDLSVKIGDKVKTKQILGKVFTDTKTSSTVLHMEVWDNLKVLDPELWLSKN